MAKKKKLKSLHPWQKAGRLPTDDELAEHLRNERLARELGWAEFSALLDVGQSTVIRICGGQSSPHDVTKAKILRRLAE